MEEKKKLLVLAGSWFQVPAIKYAKSRGYHVITCDYCPENPGHRFSDEYHNVSTTDREAVLRLARQLEIDGILCFASDPAAPTAAYVSEQMGLPGNTLENVCKFGEKHLWREFLRENGFNVPKAKSYLSWDEVDMSEWTCPVMVKPVDSCGSKGITKVCRPEDMKAAYEYALQFGNAKRVIIEDFIERVGPQIGGDGYYGEDRLEFVCYGDQVVDTRVNGIVPCGMTFPSLLDKSVQDRITEEIERAIRLSGLRHLSFNLEVMIDRQGRIFLMELGPRNGGNCIPEVIEQYTGINMVGLAVEASMGGTLPVKPECDGCFHAYYALHSVATGVYRGYVISDDFPGEVTISYMFKSPGDRIGSLVGSNEEIGVLVLKFETREKMNSFFAHPDKFIQIQLEEQI